MTVCCKGLRLYLAKFNLALSKEQLEANNKLDARIA